MQHGFNIRGDFQLTFVAVQAQALPGVIDKIVVADNAICLRVILVGEA